MVFASFCAFSANDFISTTSVSSVTITGVAITHTTQIGKKRFILVNWLNYMEDFIETNERNEMRI